MVDYSYNYETGYSVLPKYMIICNLSENSHIYEYETRSNSGFFMIFSNDEKSIFVFPEGGCIGQKTISCHEIFSLEEIKNIFEKDINSEKNNVFGLIGDVKEGRNNKTLDECVLDFRYLMLTRRTSEVQHSKNLSTERLVGSFNLLNSIIHHFSAKDFSDYPKQNIDVLNLILKKGIKILKCILHEFENNDPGLLNRILPTMYQLGHFCEETIHDNGYYFSKGSHLRPISYFYLNGNSCPMHKYLERREDKKSYEIESFFGPLDNIFYPELLSIKENSFIMITKYMEEIFKCMDKEYTIRNDFNHRLLYK